MKKHTHYIKDFGRVIPMAKKEIYQKKNGQYTAYLSKTWPKRSIQKMSEDRYCRYLISCLYENFQTSLRSEQEDMVLKYIEQVEHIREELTGIEESDEFFTILRRIDYGHDINGNLLFDHDLIFTDGKIDYSNMNALAMEKVYYEMTPTETAYTRASRRIWHLHALDVYYNAENNQVEIEMPYEYDIIILTISPELNFREQDIEGDFLVETDLNTGEHKIVELNVSEAIYRRKFNQVYEEELSKLTQDTCKRKRNRRITENLSENPGVRQGRDYHLGSIREQEFETMFGFSGQFGNCLPQKQRAFHLRRLTEAFLDLAEVIGCDPKCLSLPKEGKNLGIALAARGSGRAKAHYEPEEHVINITKPTLLSNNGCLAHEWGHALDYAIRKRNLSEYQAVLKFLEDPTTRFSRDAVCIDLLEGRREAYWNSLNEKFARAFSSYVVEKLRRAGRQNDYLAFNYNDKIEYKDEWISVNPKDEDLDVLVSLFDDLFKVVKREEIFWEMSDSLIALDALKKPSKKSSGRIHGIQLTLF